MKNLFEIKLNELDEDELFDLAIELSEELRHQIDIYKELTNPTKLKTDLEKLIFKLITGVHIRNFKNVIEEFANMYDDYIHDIGIHCDLAWRESLIDMCERARGLINDIIIYNNIIKKQNLEQNEE